MLLAFDPQDLFIYLSVGVLEEQEACSTAGWRWFLLCLQCVEHVLILRRRGSVSHVQKCSSHTVCSLHCAETLFALVPDGLRYKQKRINVLVVIALYRKANVERIVAIFLSHYSLIQDSF